MNSRGLLCGPGSRGCPRGNSGAFDGQFPSLPAADWVACRAWSVLLQFSAQLLRRVRRLGQGAAGAGSVIAVGHVARFLHAVRYSGSGLGRATVICRDEGGRSGDVPKQNWKFCARVARHGIQRSAANIRQGVLSLFDLFAMLPAVTFRVRGSDSSKSRPVPPPRMNTIMSVTLARVRVLSVSLPPALVTDLGGACGPGAGQPVPQGTPASRTRSALMRRRVNGCWHQNRSSPAGYMS